MGKFYMKNDKVPKAARPLICVPFYFQIVIKAKTGGTKTGVKNGQLTAPILGDHFYKFLLFKDFSQ